MQTLDKRLDAVTTAQNMSRVSLSVALLLAVLILMSQFNAYFSWYRAFALEDFDVQQADGSSRPAPVPHLRREVVDQWLSGRSFRIPFVDIPILPSDISVLGGLAIAISTIFLMFYARREHFAISFLLRDAQRNSRTGDKRAILHSVLTGFVFITLSSRRKPYKHLSDVPRLPKTGGSGIRWPFWLLIFLPAIALFLAILADLWSYFFVVSPFRGHVPAVDWKTNWESLFRRKVLSLLFALWTTFNCRAVYRFQRATARIVKEYIKSLR